MFQTFLKSILVFGLIFPAGLLHAESVDEEFTHISPRHSPGTGEYVHGQGYGKILIRLLMFGAIPQQGIHYVPEGTDLLFALLYAGGYGDSTKLNGITIRRRNVPELIEVNLEGLIEEGGAIPKLTDGDIINVPHNWRRDYQEFIFFTSIFTSLTSLVLSITLLAR
ncbi:hypothetical protein K2X33_05765 [bacterium]|nr:hypothetical protein [bacterium]